MTGKGLFPLRGAFPDLEGKTQIFSSSWLMKEESDAKKMEEAQLKDKRGPRLSNMGD